MVVSYYKQKPLFAYQQVFFTKSSCNYCRLTELCNNMLSQLVQKPLYIYYLGGRAVQASKQLQDKAI